MANYFDVAAIQELAPAPVVMDELSQPKIAAVNNLITRITNQVNVALVMGGVALPISVGEVDFLGNLKLICAREAVFQIMATRGLKAGSQAEEPLWKTWHKDYQDALTRWSKTSPLASASTANVPSGTKELTDPWFDRDKTIF